MYKQKTRKNPHLQIGVRFQYHQWLHAYNMKLDIEEFVLVNMVHIKFAPVMLNMHTFFKIPKVVRSLILNTPSEYIWLTYTPYCDGFCSQWVLAHHHNHLKLGMWPLMLTWTFYSVGVECHRQWCDVFLVNDVC